jgi:hypothetical protein
MRALSVFLKEVVMVEMTITKAKLSEIAKKSRGISYDELVRISSLAEKMGGALVDIAEPDDDWCGTGVVKIPFPGGPKHIDIGDLINYLTNARINYEVIINGIPVPDEVIITARRSRMF